MTFVVALTVLIFVVATVVRQRWAIMLAALIWPLIYLASLATGWRSEVGDVWVAVLLAQTLVAIAAAAAGVVIGREFAHSSFATKRRTSSG